ncbi:PIN domain-containing protein [Salinigranum sp. GCM10025319]|uniref:PIN domain-containing protein n=1 Tax=Salinigranum sp. GCM10025319 TaxID=3252687 RepID=UPI00361ABDE4
MDTNALMMPIERDVRVFDELARLLGEPVDGAASVDLVVPRAVVAELEKLAAGAGEEGVAASVGRDLADRCRVVDTDADYADDAVVELAAAADYVVTADRPLRDRLLDRNVPVVGLRGRNTLAITEP